MNQSINQQKFSFFRIMPSAWTEALNNVDYVV